MLDQMQAPVIPSVSDQAYKDVRTMQLKSPREQPFSMPFLMWVYSELLEEVFDKLPPEEHKMVDTLLMLNTYVTRADSGKPFTGMDVETLTDVLAQSTHMMSWE